MTNHEDVLRREAPSSGRQGYFDKSLTLRILIGLLLAFAVFLVLHFRETRIHVVELGTSAERYIIADVAFTFPDNEATIILQQEALRDLGKIFRLSADEVRERQDQFERGLSEDESWRSHLQGTTFEEMYRGIDQMTGTLIESRFTDARTLKKLEGVGVDSADYILFSPPDTPEEIYLPEDVWAEIRRAAFADADLEPATVQFIVAYFAQSPWEMEEDIPTMLAMREKVQRALPAQRASVAAGTRILAAGEEVMPRHVVMVQALNQALRAQSRLWSPLTLIGSALLTVLFMLVIAIYLRMYHPSIYLSNRRLFLLTVIVVLDLVLAKGTEYLLLTSRTHLLDWVRFPLVVPFAGILLTSLMNARLATYVTFFLSIILSLSLAVDGNDFLVINLLTSLVAIVSTRTLRQRKEIFVVCGKAWACAALIVIAYHLYAYSFWSWLLFADLVSTFVFMLLTAVIVVGLLPLLESLFRIITDIIIMEYMDPTHPLLRRLSIEAPGTYQHSIVVGNLAEAGALQIGANGLFCRAAPLYHDIGKIISPQYFTENQQEGVDPHQLLTPLESAQAIMAHVTEGVVLARKYGVPEPFIDVIKEHHGTQLVYFFYHKQVELEGGDASKISEADFRYAGPKPRSKESAIIMIADTVEAASRSLDDVTLERVEPMIDRLVREKADDGQFDNCLLTFEELVRVKEALARALVAARHTRVAYPARIKLPPAGPGDDPAMEGSSP